MLAKTSFRMRSSGLLLLGSLEVSLRGSDGLRVPTLLGIFELLLGLVDLVGRLLVLVDGISMSCESGKSARAESDRAPGHTMIVLSLPCDVEGTPVVVLAIFWMLPVQVMVVVSSRSDGVRI